jgi:hypothetical protein
MTDWIKAYWKAFPFILIGGLIMAFYIPPVVTLEKGLLCISVGLAAMYCISYLMNKYYKGKTQATIDDWEKQLYKK